jgi:hypothetical protein
MNRLASYLPRWNWDICHILVLIGTSLLIDHLQSRRSFPVKRLSNIFDDWKGFGKPFA